MAKDHQYQGEMALAIFNYCLLSGTRPDKKIAEFALEYAHRYFDYPVSGTSQELWDTYAPRMRQLESSSGILAFWETYFNADHTPTNTKVARQFNIYVAQAYLRFAEWDRRLTFVTRRAEKGSSSDYETAFPIGRQVYTLYLTRDGRATLISGADIKTVASGDIVILPPACKCKIKRASGADVWVAHKLHFQLSSSWWYLTEWFVDLNNPYVIHLNSVDDDLLNRGCEDLANMAYSNGLIEERLRMNLLESLLLRLNLIAAPSNSNHDSRVAKAAHFILDNIGEPFEIQAVADHVGISAAHLGVLFRQQMGIGLCKWRGKTRIEIAADMLENSTLSIAEVAFRVGFDDPLYFSRQFKKQMNCSPSEYRDG